MSRANVPRPGSTRRSSLATDRARAPAPVEWQCTKRKTDGRGPVAPWPCARNGQPVLARLYVCSIARRRAVPVETRTKQPVMQPVYYTTRVSASSAARTCGFMVRYDRGDSAGTDLGQTNTATPTDTRVCASGAQAAQRAVCGATRPSQISAGDQQCGPGTCDDVSSAGPCLWR